METWTDERLDEFATALRPLPQEVGRLAAAVEHRARETAHLGDEIGSSRTDVRTEIGFVRDDVRSLREEFSAFQRQFAVIGWSVVAALIGVLAAVLATGS